MGRFEGAFYTASGYYRPKQDSIMRTLEGPVGEVNAEAWLRALYRAIPPIRAAYPEQRVVPGLAGTDVEFEIVSPWSPELMTVRWFVDGNEIEQARGSYFYRLHADGSRHEVRVTIEDCTGSIRAPDAREQAGADHLDRLQSAGLGRVKGAGGARANRQLDPHARRFFRPQRAGNHPRQLDGARGRPQRPTIPDSNTRYSTPRARCWQRGRSSTRG